MVGYIFRKSVGNDYIAKTIIVKIGNQRASSSSRFEKCLKKTYITENRITDGIICLTLDPGLAAVCFLHIDIDNRSNHCSDTFDNC